MTNAEASKSNHIYKFMERHFDWHCPSTVQNFCSNTLLLDRALLTGKLSSEAAELLTRYMLHQEKLPVISMLVNVAHTIRVNNKFNAEEKKQRIPWIPKAYVRNVITRLRLLWLWISDPKARVPSDFLNYWDTSPLGHPYRHLSPPEEEHGIYGETKNKSLFFI